MNGENLLLEVKAWNALNSPAFDLANFESYIQTIEEDPLKLDAYYLIMGYIADQGKIKINDIYLKNIWEVTGKGRNTPLTIQRKRGVIYNIRPVNFPKESANPYNDKLDFLNAIKETMVNYNTEKKDMDAWLNHVVTEYNKNTQSTPIRLNP